MLVIDTERAHQKLLQGGHSEEQAQAQLAVWRQVSEGAAERIATKEDLEKLKVQMWRAVGVGTGLILAALAIATTIIVSLG